MLNNNLTLYSNLFRKAIARKEVRSEKKEKRESKKSKGYRNIDGGR